MAHVAVECPVSGNSGKFQIPGLAYANNFSHFSAPLMFRPPATVGAGNLELHTMQMHRVIPHRQGAYANPYALSGPSHHGISIGKDSAVHAPQSKLRHHAAVRSVSAGVDAPVVQHDRIIPIHRW